MDDPLGSAKRSAAVPAIYVADMLREWRDILSNPAAANTSSFDVESSFLTPTNATVESAMAGDGMLESLGEPVSLSARLPSRPEHRNAAASALLALVFVIVSLLIVMAGAIRPSLRHHQRGSAKSSMGTAEERSPIHSVEEGRVGASATTAAAASSQRSTAAPPPGLQSYNTFAGEMENALDTDAAWLAAKRDWQHAIHAARNPQPRST